MQSKHRPKHINILKNEIDRVGSQSVDHRSIDLFFHDPYPIRSDQSVIPKSIALLEFLLSKLPKLAKIYLTVPALIQQPLNCAVFINYRTFYNI